MDATNLLGEVTKQDIPPPLGAEAIAGKGVFGMVLGVANIVEGLLDEPFFTPAVWVVASLSGRLSAVIQSEPSSLFLCDQRDMRS